MAYPGYTSLRGGIKVTHLPPHSPGFLQGYPALREFYSMSVREKQTQQVREITLKQLFWHFAKVYATPYVVKFLY